MDHVQKMDTIYMFDWAWKYKHWNDKLSVLLKTTKSWSIYQSIVLPRGHVGVALYPDRCKRNTMSLLFSRRYIQDVLQLYNDTSDDSCSDGSIDDNPESNNLFDRLSRPI